MDISQLQQAVRDTVELTKPDVAGAEKWAATNEGKIPGMEGRPEAVLSAEQQAIDEGLRMESPEAAFQKEGIAEGADAPENAVRVDAADRCAGDADDGTRLGEGNTTNKAYKDGESLSAGTDSLEKDNPSEKELQMNQNREAGERREKEAVQELKERYPEKEGYKVETEQVLRNENGSVAKDPVTGEKRIVDVVVSKEGKAIRMVEVTSHTAPKDAQMAKEQRIRDAGGNYVKDKDTGDLKWIPDDVTTEVHRRD